LLHGDENSLYKQWLTRGCVLDDLTCLFRHPTRPTSRLSGSCSTCQDVSVSELMLVAGKSNNRQTTTDLRSVEA